MGVAINDKHRVHARKKESFSRVTKGKEIRGQNGRKRPGILPSEMYD